ncbi:zf-HC2 domain-containing protein [Limisalsivibrio acetivorans]|uniref:zf-HC2 domain-containing protein n=1 Tax=Limisalsivibrio acetivorans TaxID=1304888 RepID=UPI0003B6FAA2|nr:zf-HC2 domain-containing protein [Limisalsivibrio acetivorans]
MDCTRHRKNISAYIDSECSSLESAALEAHLKKCTSCKAELTESYKLGSMIKDAYSSAEEVDFTASIMGSINKEQEAAPKEQKGRLRLVKPAAAAAVIAAGLIALAAANSFNNEPQLAKGNEMLEKYVFEHVDSSYTEAGTAQIGVVNYDR